MPEGICNKCGERKELVLAGCVCRSCNDSLDEQWANSPATDWVLIAIVQDRHYHGPSLPTDIIMKQLKESLSATRAHSEASGRKGFSVLARLYRLSRLTGTSPDAALFESEEEYNRYVYRNTTYAQMKSNWAECNPPDGLDIGSAAPEEIAEVRSISGSWAKRPEPTFIRPATTEETAKYDAVQRDRQRCQESTRIFEKWGFDLHKAVPLDGAWDVNAERMAKNALEETRKRSEELGLLNGSVLNDEEWNTVSADRSSILGQKGPNPGYGLSQVAGMTQLKEQLMHEVIGPFTDPELYRRYRVSLPNGILFYGPPGCGKTYIARGLAEELGWSFQYCRPSDVASPYIHDTVSRIRKVFATAIEEAPSVVFIDEFEAFVPARSELGGHQQYKAEEVNEFLANLEGCAERNVLVIGATNEPEKIDPAVRRSGRFDKLILIPAPDAEARRAMLEFHLNGRPVEESLDTAGVAAVLEGYSASDIKLLVDEAARIALKRTEPISTGTLLAALERVPASITREDIQRYSAFRSRGS